MSDLRAPRRTRRAAALAAVVAGAALLGACTDEDGPRPDGRPAPAVAGPSGGATGGPVLSTRPELRERLEVTVRTGREVFVQPSCTPDPGGERNCWREVADPFVLEGPPRRVTLTAAVTDLDQRLDRWYVDLTLAPGSRAAVAAALADARGPLRLALTTEAERLVALHPGEAVTLDGDRLRLGRLDKRDAWALVDDLVGLAAFARG